MCTRILTDTQVCTIRHNFKLHSCIIPRIFNLRQLANTVKIWLQIISSKDPFSQVFLLEMDLCKKHTSVLIPFPYTHAGTWRHDRCNFVCAQLTQHLLTFHNLCFVSCLTQPYKWLWLGAAVQCLMVTIWKIFHF